MTKISIGNRNIGDDEDCFIVAELGVNHNRDFKIAKKSIARIAESGADAVKVQTWKTDNIIQKNCPMVDYQKHNLGYEESQYEMLKKLELPYEWHEDLRNYAEKMGLVFFSTMEDKDSVDFLLRTIKIPLIKVGSGDLTNYPLLRYTAQYHIPMVLSTGMSSMEEIEKAINIVKAEKNESVIVLQCTTNYPVQYSEVNLLAMITMRNRFSTIIGFSDHTLGNECAIAAVALGAKYLEKHFTLDRDLIGPDHKASLEPEKFKEMVTSIRNVEKAMGNGEKMPFGSELKLKSKICRKIVASKDIKVGETISEEKIVFKRAEKGIDVKDYDFINGKRAIINISKNMPIEFDFLG